jgi:hypothetical protein
MTLRDVAGSAAEVISMTSTIVASNPLLDRKDARDKINSRLR